MAEWPCFEPVSPGSSGSKTGFRRPMEAYSQGLGSMITEPPTDGQRTPCRILKPCILAVQSLPSFAGPLSAMTGPNQDYARLRRKFNDHDGSYRLGDGSLGTGLMGTSTRLNDE